MSWRGVIGIALLLVAIISGWSAWRQREAPVPAAANDARSDYVLRNFELTALDQQTGKESMTLRAPEMHRNRADQTLDITTPLFLLPDAAGNYWQLRAKTGWVSAKGDELRLRDDVAGDSPQDGTTPATTFRTGRMDVFPQTHLARTDDKVTMTRPGIMQTGVGFEANLKTEQYKLLSQVKTRYEPNAR